MTAPPSAEEVAEIAKGLTEPQRKVLIAASRQRFKTGEATRRHAKVRGPWPSRPNYRVFSYLWEYGKPEKWGVVRHRRLSVLGLAVRNHLIGETR